MSMKPPGIEHFFLSLHTTLAFHLFNFCVQVIKKKAWRNVAKELSLPASITSAAFTMRSQ